MVLVSPKSQLFEVVARTGKALGSGKRLELLDLLAQMERSVQELAEAADLNVTTASAHLQVLRDAGLVASRRDGTRIYYRLSGPEVATLVADLCRLAETQRPEVQAALRSFAVDDDVRVLSRAELVDASTHGDVVVLDVRPPEEFAAGHLRGARSIPLVELAGRLDEIPMDAEVVAYCRGRYCVLSHDAVRLLQASGRRAALSAEGILDWLGTDVPLDASGGDVSQALG
jgi:DNA-binding transcriptional ArsR family regulator/rhodanese-related sulfurtransferase